MKNLAFLVFFLSATALAGGTYGRYSSSSQFIAAVTSVSGTPPISVSDGTADAVVAIGLSNAAADGYLSSGDWATFNAKVGTARSISTTAPLAGGGNLSADRTLSITQAGNAGNGYLSSTDWQTFNSKQSTLSAADASHNGYLASGDWTAFNGKQPLLTSSSALVPFQSIKLYNVGGTHFLRMDMANAAADYQIIWPAAAPDPGTVLTSDGSGNLSWGSAGAGPQWKAAVTCIATNQSAIDWSSQFVDCDNGYNPTTGDRFLVAGFPGQEADEGLYDVDGGGNFVRPADAATTADYQSGVIVPVGLGAGFGTPAVWIQTAAINTLGTTAQVWEKFVSSTNAPTASGACSVSSTTVSTTPSNVTCTGVPASAAVAVTCSGAAAFSTPGGDALYARATGTANQLALNTVTANVTAMTFACSWVQP